MKRSCYTSLTLLHLSITWVASCKEPLCQSTPCWLDRGQWRGISSERKQLDTDMGTTDAIDANDTTRIHDLMSLCVCVCVQWCKWYPVCHKCSWCHCDPASETTSARLKHFYGPAPFALNIVRVTVTIESNGWERPWSELNWSIRSHGDPDSLLSFQFTITSVSGMSCTFIWFSTFSLSLLCGSLVMRADFLFARFQFQVCGHNILLFAICFNVYHSMGDLHF